MSRRLIGLVAVMLLAVLVAAIPATGQQSRRGEAAKNPPVPTAVQRAEAQQTPRPGPRGNVFVGRGSDTTSDVLGSLCSLYNFAPRSVNPNGDRCLNQPPEGSSIGIQELATQRDVLPNGDATQRGQLTSFARSSRRPRLPGGSSTADPAGLRFRGFAIDGIVPVTFGEDPASPAAGLENLNDAQLLGIFTNCTIRNFNDAALDAGNPGLAARTAAQRNGVIEVFAIQRGSGTRSDFDRLLNQTDPGPDRSNISESCVDKVGGSPSTGPSDSRQTDPNRIVFENAQGPVFEAQEGGQAVANRAIFAFSFARLTTSGRGADEDVNALRLNGIEADSTTLTNRSFPFSRTVFQVEFTNPNDRRADSPRGGRTGPVDAMDNEAATRLNQFICGIRGANVREPTTGLTYGRIIEQTIRSKGFGVVRPCTDART